MVKASSIRKLLGTDAGAPVMRSTARRLVATLAIITSATCAALVAIPSSGTFRMVAAVDAPHDLASSLVRARGSSANGAYEGVVEAVRQTVVAAQVSGAIVSLQVRPGDTVRAGQVLMRLDARAADQISVAGAAKASAARAAMDAATREFRRQQQLLAQHYISQTSFDWAEAHFKAAQAEASAQLADARAAKAQSGFYTVRAPYGGTVATVPVVLGDMAMPGRPLVTMYDPTALRVTASVPQSAATKLASTISLEIPDAVDGPIVPVHVQLLPTVDAASHTLELRLDLPAGTNAMPGMFARAILPTSGVVAGTGDAKLFVPAKALVRRSEFNGVYVIGDDGKPTLRQVRPGPEHGTEVEILSGVKAGERVAIDPQAAARRT